MTTNSFELKLILADARTEAPFGHHLRVEGQSKVAGCELRRSDRGNARRLFLRFALAIRVPMD
jgi:hypothetical protein